MKIKIDLELSQESINFTKKLTGILDDQEAIEHFVAICVTHGVSPQEILDQVNVDILEGYE